MNMPPNLFATAFRKQHLGLMFSMIMIIMVFLGSLAMAAQATLVRTSVTWGFNLQNRFTVEVPASSDETPEMRAARVEKIRKSIAERTDITRAEIITDEETSKLLKPWIKDTALLAALPLPTLIDVDVAIGATLSPTELSDDLARMIDGVQVHSHANWMDRLLGFLTGLGYLAVIMLLLTALALVLSIVVICRAAMAVQHDTIELLHFMGATDRSIAQQFQKHVHVLSIPSSLIGFVLAVATVALLALLLQSLGGLSLIAPLSWLTVAAVMAVVPLGAVALATVTARFSVQRFLRRLP